MSGKIIRIGFTVLWAAVCIVLICLLAGGSFGGFIDVSPNVRVGSELLREEASPAGDVQQLEISANNLSVYVTGTDSQTFTARHYGAKNTPEEELVTVRRDGGILHIEVPQINRIRIVWMVRERLEIEVPRQWLGAVNAETGSGSLNVEEAFSWKEVSLRTSSGSLRVKRPLRADGAFRAQTSSGSLKLDELTAVSADLQTTSGSLNAAGNLTLTGGLTASTSSGSLRLEGDIKAQSIRASTRSGHLRAERLETETFDLSTTSGGISGGIVTGAGRIKSSSGSIGVDTLRLTGDTDISATSGSVRVAVPQEIAFSFEGNCTSGSIGGDYELYYRGKNNKSAYYDNGENGPKLRAETSSGGIRLMK